MVNMWSLFFGVLSPLLSFIGRTLLWIFGLITTGIVLFFLFFWLRYKIRLDADYLASLSIIFKPYDLVRWFLFDFVTRAERRGIFRPYGFSLFVGRQGGGKTIAMVDYLAQMRRRYPDCLIVTNFRCDLSDHRMTDWRDLFEIRNGDCGVIFAIDEIHTEYNAESWKDFPETLLSQISQQRKQKVKIIASAQVYSRVVKQIREQTFSVICCSTYLGRLTVTKEYDAAEYATADTPYQVKKKCKPIDRHIFVQSNRLRSCYDTYEVIERLARTDFISRDKR